MKFSQAIHHNIKKLMYAENCYIALYDAGTETTSFPFFIPTAGSKSAPEGKSKRHHRICVEDRKTTSADL